MFCPAERSRSMLSIEQSVEFGMSSTLVYPALQNSD